MPSGANRRCFSSVSMSAPARRATAYDSTIEAKLEYSNFVPGAAVSVTSPSEASSAVLSSFAYGSVMSAAPMREGSAGRPEVWVTMWRSRMGVPW